MNTRYTSGRDVGDYLVELETSLSKLSSLGLPVAENMQVALSLVSLMNEDALPGTVAAMKP